MKSSKAHLVVNSGFALLMLSALLHLSIRMYARTLQALAVREKSAYVTMATDGAELLIVLWCRERQGRAAVAPASFIGFQQGAALRSWENLQRSHITLGKPNRKASGRCFSNWLLRKYCSNSSLFYATSLSFPQLLFFLHLL